MKKIYFALILVVMILIGLGIKDEGIYPCKRTFTYTGFVNCPKECHIELYYDYYWLSYNQPLPDNYDGTIKEFSIARRCELLE